MKKDTAKELPFLTEAEILEVAQMLNRKYAGYMKQRYFEVALTKDAKGVYAKITLRNKTGAFYYPVEGRVASIDHDMSARDAAMFLVDYMDAYFDEYFKADGEVYLPIDWSEYEFDGVPIQLKGQIFNLVVEKMADDLLERGRIPDHELH